MGLLLLDISLRIEKEFKIEIPDNWYGRLGIWKAGEDVTLADYHRFILALCQEQYMPDPPNSWQRLVVCVAGAAGIDPREITPASLLLDDIAPNG